MTEHTAITPRERRLLRMILTACYHIQTELDPLGSDEIRQHPIYRAKLGFLQRAEKAIQRIEGD